MSNEYRAFLILPLALVPAGNEIASQMGWGQGDVYSIPITDGSGEITHKGLSTVLSQSFVDMLASPPEFPWVSEVMGALIMDNGPAEGADARAQVKALMVERGLEVWEASETA
ncbi:MAG: hypothetical protein JXQ89_17430 [Pelagimonas sp.]